MARKARTTRRRACTRSCASSASATTCSRLPDSTFAGDEEYVFKHNLERETLLKLTPPGTARRYHAAVADWLASKDYVRTHEESLGMLARHREAAGRKTQAAHANLAAADVARAQYANQKAADYYKRGLELAAGGAESRR